MVLFRCRGPIWRYDDFSDCFRREYLETLLPIIIASLSLMILGLSLSLHLKDSYEKSHEAIRPGTRIDDPEEYEHLLFARISKTPASGRHEEQYFPRPRLETILKASESLAVLALIGVHIVSWTILGHSLPGIVGTVFWSYVSLLVLVRNFRISSPIWSQRLFVHTVLIYSCQWPSAFFQLRTALIRDVSRTYLLLQIVNIALVTALFVISVTSRLDDVPRRKVSSRNLPSSQEKIASLFSLGAFNWINPVIWEGYFRPHNMDNVWDLDEDDYAQSVLEAFTHAKKATNMTFSLLRHFKGLLIKQGLWAVMYSLFTFAPTLLLKLILEYLEDPKRVPRGVAWLYCVGLLLGAVFTTIGNGQALWIGRRVCIRLRAIIVGEVYAKALRRRDVAASGTDEDNGNANNGQIINLMAIDAFKVAEICAYLHYLLASVPIELGIAVFLLYAILGWSALAGIASMVALLPLNYFISRQFSKIQADLMKVTDIRINRMNELLNSMRIIKFFAWEESFVKDINDCRKAELKQLRRRFVMFSIASLSWNASPVLITLLTFLAYTKIAHKELTASVAFTSLSLFNVLRAPLDQLADMITNVLQSKVSLDRVTKFLDEEETLKYDHLYKKGASSHAIRIGFVDATFTWASQQSVHDKAQEANDNSKVFEVQDLNVEFKENVLNIICGPTGSGKTSLLMALLGEMTPLKGDAYLPGSRNREAVMPLNGSIYIESVAYCAQQPWLLNDSVRNNILFALPFDEHRYNSVIEACALSRDLEILEHGDATEIGEKGITLSGGQKQRVSLARAIYSNARYLLLDDCLSAVDSHTAKWIFENALTGVLVEARTRILVTHNVALCLPTASFVVAIDNGRVIAQGTPIELINQNITGLNDDALKVAVSVANSAANSRVPSRVPSVAHISKDVENQQGSKADAPHAKKDEVRKEGSGGNLIKEETRAEGSVGWRVYSKYLRSLGGPFFFILIIAGFLGQQGMNIAQTWWIRQWAASYHTKVFSLFFATANLRSDGLCATSLSGSSTISITHLFASVRKVAFQTTNPQQVIGTASQDQNLNYYLVIYALLALAFCCTTFFRITILFWGSIRASMVLHEELLEKVVGSKLRFFDATPIGRIMNRFSKDLETVDQEIAVIALGFVHDVLSVAAIVVLITVITPGFLVAGLLISLLYIAVGAFYVRSSRELKRLESVSRSPIYQHFGETLVGISTIRAYGDELRFVRDNLAKIDTNNRPFYYLWACNRWLSIRIDLGGALVSFFAAIFVILNVETLDAGLAGLSLTYAISFTDHMLWVVRLYALNEMNMNSVERISEFLDIEQEAPAILPDNRSPKGWPSNGKISVKDLVLKYAPELPAVIKGVSFDVEPGQKVGIVGRTGAGKSTIATAFFRLMEPTEGSITIDDVDISTIGLRDLRQGLTIIPQDPTLFQRTLRYNLDPFNEHSDSEMFESLRRVHLIDPDNTPASSVYETSSSNVNVFVNLDTAIAEGGGNLSQGQKQLLCLARALLRLPRVILMDECTAAVDYATDAKIQKTIREEFAQSTILTIAHRLRSICDYDKILVLDSGQVKEYDHPHILLQKSDGIFRNMCEMSGEMESLVEMAEIAFKRGPLLDLNEIK